MALASSASSLPSPLLLPLLIVLFLPFSASFVPLGTKRTSFPGGASFKNNLGGELEDGMVSLRRLAAEAPLLDLPFKNGSFILAAERTHRRDPLNGLHRYTGGWNISEYHYWASVGFTAAPLFAIALAWFVIFGVVLMCICCWFCCCRRRNYSYSRVAYGLSLALLVLFTCAAIIGCAVLYTGQGKFHESTTETLNYLVGQANFTVENLRNFSDSLAVARYITVDEVLLPSNVQGDIVAVVEKVNSSADYLASRTMDNYWKITSVLDRVGMDLIIIAAVMLLLAFLGFLLSILGLQTLVSLLAAVGWILVTGTFILCGVFLLLHNVVADTCVAMNEWVEHPHAHTALDDILPCVDAATANESLTRSREVTSQLVDVVNKVITNASNGNFDPATPFLYFNQTGPLVPTLCNPYTPDLNDRPCNPGEVDLNNAAQVWKEYLCEVDMASGVEVCKTVGRITPNIYGQMKAAVTICLGLQRYVPFLADLEDCTFARETFESIHANNCPDLEKNIRYVYIGLVMVSAAVMLSSVFWLIYARERRHRKYNELFLAPTDGPQTGDKRP